MATRYCGNVRVTIRPDYNKRPTLYRCTVRYNGGKVRIDTSAPLYRSIADDSPEALDQAAHAALSFADDFTAGEAIEGADHDGTSWQIRRKR